MKVKKPYVLLKQEKHHFIMDGQSSSMPNKSYDRRIGFNIQYVATHVKQMKNDTDTAICVRGIDKYNNFGIDIPAVSDELTPTTVAKQKELQEKYKSIASSRN